jgi:hypothetical protein
MVLELNHNEHYRETVDKFIDPIANVYMTTRDYVVRPSAAGRQSGFTVYLPPVAEARGRFYSILALDTTYDITIADMDDSEDWDGDFVLTDTDQDILFYSDGRKWFHLDSLSSRVNGPALFDNIIKHHYHNVAADQYAYQLRTETLLATTQFFGMDAEVHQAANRTADGVEGLSMTARLVAGFTMSGNSSLIPIRGNLDIDGIINGAGIFSAGYFVVDDGGTFTALSHLASLWLDSHQTGVVGGSHELLYMTNNGASVMDCAIYLRAGNAITNFISFDTCGGMIGAKVDADIAYAHYRTLAVTVDGLPGKLFIEMDA